MVWARVVEKNQLLEVKLDRDTNLVSLISTSTNSSINNMINEALSKVQLENEDTTDQGTLSYKFSLLMLLIFLFYSVVNSKADTLPSTPFPLEENRLVQLLVLHNIGDSLTCCPADSPLIRHVLDTQVRQAAKLVAEGKEGSYAPKYNEVCLAKFTGKNLGSLFFNAKNKSIIII